MEKDVEYEVHCDKNVLIPMRDGVTLAADIFRPATSGEFPAILRIFPYRKDDRFLTQEKSGKASTKDHYFAPRGYAEVWLDTRGTGSSDGATFRLYGSEEVRDAHDTIAWIAKQPWCNGKVGITGSSYGGYNSFIITASNPPYLQAAAPMAAGISQHHHYHPGGCMPMYLWLAYYMPRMLAGNLSPPSFIDEKGRWKEIWDTRIEKSYPWLLNVLDNPPSSDQWNEYSIDHKLSELRIPTLFISGLIDITVYCHLPFFDSGRVKCPFKTILGPWVHGSPDEMPVGQIDHNYEILRWFDYWLKGKDTGVMNEPPLSIYVERRRAASVFPTRVVGEWRNENEWPLKRAVKTTFYLGPGGELGKAPPPTRGADPYNYDPSVGTGMGLPLGGDLGYVFLDQREDDARSLTYTTNPLEEDLEVTGVPSAILYASSSADTINYVVKLCDIAPDGTSVAVSRGRLNAARRDSRDPQPIIPGEVYELNIWMDGLAYVFEKGQRIRLSISSSDFPYIWPSPKNSTNIIYRGPDRQSRLLLPVVPEQIPRLPSPRFRPSLKPVMDWSTRPTAAPVARDVKRTNYNITKDIVGSRLIVHSTSHNYQVEERKSVHIDVDKEASVSTKDPADARARCSASMKVLTPEIRSEVNVKSLVQSDLDCFRATLLANISLNGMPYAEKKWVKTYPRDSM